MSPALLARLEAEVACACDPATRAAADVHALRCYRQQLIDAPTLGRLRAVLIERPAADQHTEQAPTAEDRRTR